jgi:hypothetical protein
MDTVGVVTALPEAGVPSAGDIDANPVAGIMPWPTPSPNAGTRSSRS